MRVFGLVFLLATLPLVAIGLAALAGRDYVSGALVLGTAIAIGHLGLELVALMRPTSGDDDEVTHDGLDARDEGGTESP